MKARAVIILIEDGRVAMIERRRQGSLFYVFPGGHVELGEQPIEAAIREAKEELGLDVTVVRLVARSTYAGRPHFYYLAFCTGGEFGSGHGKELSRPADSERGSVRPVWLSIRDFDKVVVYPARMAQLVSQVNEKGWPAEPLEFVEPESPIN